MVGVHALHDFGPASLCIRAMVSGKMSKEAVRNAEGNAAKVIENGRWGVAPLLLLVMVQDTIYGLIDGSWTLNKKEGEKDAAGVRGVFNSATDTMVKFIPMSRFFRNRDKTRGRTAYPAEASLVYALYVLWREVNGESLSARDMGQSVQEYVATAYKTKKAKGLKSLRLMLASIGLVGVRDEGWSDDGDDLRQQRLTALLAKKSKHLSNVLDNEELVELLEDIHDNCHEPSWTYVGGASRVNGDEDLEDLL